MTLDFDLLLKQLQVKLYRIKGSKFKFYLIILRIKKAFKLLNLKAFNFWRATGDEVRTNTPLI